MARRMELHSHRLNAQTNTWRALILGHPTKPVDIERNRDNNDVAGLISKRDRSDGIMTSQNIGVCRRLVVGAAVAILASIALLVVPNPTSSVGRTLWSDTCRAAAATGQEALWGVWVSTSTTTDLNGNCRRLKAYVYTYDAGSDWDLTYGNWVQAKVVGQHKDATNCATDWEYDRWTCIYRWG